MKTVSVGCTPLASVYSLLESIDTIRYADVSNSLPVTTMVELSPL